MAMAAIIYLSRDPPAAAERERVIVREEGRGTK